MSGKDKRSEDTASPESFETQKLAMEALTRQLIALRQELYVRKEFLAECLQKYDELKNGVDKVCELLFSEMQQKLESQEREVDALWQARYELKQWMEENEQ